MDRIAATAQHRVYARAAEHEEAILARMDPDAAGREVREGLVAAFRRMSEDAERMLETME